MEVFMKMRLLVFLFIAVCVSGFLSLVIAQIGIPVTIPQLQQVSLDSLVKLDILQSNSAGSKLDKSPYWHGADVSADTIRVTGVVIVKPRVLTYTLARYNIFIQDTTTGQVWGGLNVLTDDTSANAQNTGITALDTGMVVTITGRSSERYWRSKQQSYRIVCLSARFRSNSCSNRISEIFTMALEIVRIQWK